MQASYFKQQTPDYLATQLSSAMKGGAIERSRFKSGMRLLVALLSVGSIVARETELLSSLLEVRGDDSLLQQCPTL